MPVRDTSERRRSSPRSAGAPIAARGRRTARCRTALTSDACSRRLVCIGNRCRGKASIRSEKPAREENSQVREPIRKIEWKDGTVRYRLVVDIGRDESGKRQQITRTFDKLKDAGDELSRGRHETNQGTD